MPDRTGQRANLIDPDDRTRKREITITDDGRITKMTEKGLSEQEEIKKLREGIITILKQKITLHSVRSGYGVFNITGFEDIADSLLRNLPIPVYIDTGELTDKERNRVFVEGYHSVSRYPAGLPKLFCGYRAISEAARAKFKSIGEIVKEGENDR